MERERTDVLGKYDQAQQGLSQARMRWRFVADGSEGDVCSVALTAFEMAAAEAAVAPHVVYHELDCRATPQFTLDGAEDAALLTADEDAAEWLSIEVARLRSIWWYLICGAQRPCRLGERCVLGPFKHDPLDQDGGYRSPEIAATKSQRIG
jgi:hypothetical protein